MNKVESGVSERSERACRFCGEPVPQGSRGRPRETCKRACATSLGKADGGHGGRPPDGTTGLMTFHEIGEALGISGESARLAYESAIRKLRIKDRVVASTR